VLHQFRAEQRRFWRNPAAVFFTVLFPVMFLFIFASIFGNDTIELPGTGTEVKVSTYYVPGIMTLAIVSATLVNLAIGLTFDRESGILKRVRMTPLPAGAFIAGRIGNCLVISAVMMVVVTGIGAVVYGVEVPWSKLPALVIVLVVACVSFCSLGFALTALIPNEDAAPPIANVAVFPLYFLSGVFIPESELSSGMLDFAGIFPIRHLMIAIVSPFDPGVTGTGIEGGDLAIVAIWGALGFAAAVRWFRWAPQSHN